MVISQNTPPINNGDECRAWDRRCSFPCTFFKKPCLLKRGFSLYMNSVERLQQYIIKMLNHKPIFINALARGGSNIIMNLLLSHPNVCISSGETHKVFKGTKWDSFFYRFKKRILYDLPIRFYTGQDIFGINWLEPRKPVPSMIQHYIDRILYYGRFKASIDTHNKYKYEKICYKTR